MLKEVFLTLKNRRHCCHLHGNRIYFAPGWEDKLKEIELLSDYPWQKLEPGTLISKSKIVNTYRVTLQDGTNIYFKRYLFYSKPFHYCLRPSKAAGEVFSYLQLAEIGVPTAKPLALGEIRRFGCLFAACIVTKAVDNSINLEDYVRTEWQNLPSSTKNNIRDLIMCETSRFCRLAHSARFYHHDLKWRNILVQRTSSDEVSGTCWIDAPRGQRRRFFRSRKGELHDLASLARIGIYILSRSQRLRFLFAYAENKLDRRQIKKMFRDVDHRLQRQPPNPYTTDS